MGRWRGEGEAWRVWGLGCVGAGPRAPGSLGRRRLSYIFEHGDIWCGTKRKLVAVIPSMGIAQPVSQIAIALSAAAM
jgi:hypothetical protein